MKTIWKGPTFQLVSVFLPEIFQEDAEDYHATKRRIAVHEALQYHGLSLAQETDILVFQGMTMDDGSLWPADGSVMRFFMEPLQADKDGVVQMGGPYKRCAHEGYELGLYRNLTKDRFPHLFYAPVPLAYPRLTTLVARA